MMVLVNAEGIPLTADGFSREGEPIRFLPGERRYALRLGWKIGFTVDCELVEETAMMLKGSLPPPPTLH